SCLFRCVLPMFRNQVIALDSDQQLTLGHGIPLANQNVLNDSRCSRAQNNTLGPALDPTGSSRAEPGQGRLVRNHQGGRGGRYLVAERTQPPKCRYAQKCNAGRYAAFAFVHGSSPTMDPSSIRISRSANGNKRGSWLTTMTMRPRSRAML